MISVTSLPSPKVFCAVRLIAKYQVAGASPLRRGSELALGSEKTLGLLAARSW